MRYELNVNEVIIYNHKIIVDSEMDKDELDSIIDIYIGCRNSLNDVYDEGIKDLEKNGHLKVISVIRDSQGDPDEAIIDDIEETE